MDYQKQQVEAIKAANELQDTANELQQKMINEIETNNRVTSTHNTVMRWLSAAIVFLAVITLWTNYNKTGRYAVSGVGSHAFVLDTRTSELWSRGDWEVIYPGTNENPEAKSTEVELEFIEDNK